MRAHTHTLISFNKNFFLFCIKISQHRIYPFMPYETMLNKTQRSYMSLPFISNCLTHILTQSLGNMSSTHFFHDWSMLYKHK